MAFYTAKHLGFLQDYSLQYKCTALIGVKYFKRQGIKWYFLLNVELCIERNLDKFRVAFTHHKTKHSVYGLRQFQSDGEDTFCAA